MRQPVWWGAGLLALVGALGAALADGPADNIPEKVRPVPPPGIQVPEADRAELEQGLADLEKAIAGLAAKPANAAHLPDIRIYQQAVRYALQHNEFFAPGDLNKARGLLKRGQERAQALAAGEAAWAVQPGLSALGYVSEIDGSVQPYGLLIPASYNGSGNQRFRLDAWFHGRGETLSEVNFLDGLHRSGGQFVRPDAFVEDAAAHYLL